MKIRLSAKKSLVLTAVSMLMCISMLIGTTYAWFSDSAVSSHNRISSGSLKLSVLRWNSEQNKFIELPKNSDNTLFKNDEKWEPGYTHAEILRIENAGSLALRYRAIFKNLNLPTNSSEISLADVIEVYAFSNPQTGGNVIPETRSEILSESSPWQLKGTLREFLQKDNVVSGTLMPKDVSGYISDVGIALSMKDDADSKYQGLALQDFDIQIYATQLTHEMDSFDEKYDIDALSAWDGVTADTNWYSKNKSVYEIYTPEQLAGLAKIVNENGTGVSYPTHRKTFKLMDDIDLGGNLWTPIGNASYRFQGTFDGQGHTIKNFKTSSGTYGGFFGQIEGANIRNVNISNAYITVNDKYAGVAAGMARTSTIENVHISGCSVKGLQAVGGMIGYQFSSSASPNTVTVTECSVNNTIVSGVYYTGGIAGLASSLVIDKTTASAESRFIKPIQQYTEVEGHLYRIDNKNLAWAALYCENSDVVKDNVTYHGKAHD